MKSIFILSFISFLFIPFSRVYSETNSGILMLSVSGIAESTGTVKIAVFNTAANYQEKSNPTLKGSIPATSNELIWKQELVPYGTYAVAVYHDVNNNGVLDKKWGLLPHEPYGFSNNRFGTMGPPSFDEVKFDVRAPTTTIKIELKKNRVPKKKPKELE